jgi:hypothetical protein
MTHEQLDAHVPLATIVERLPLAFPEGTPNRTYCIREMAAKTIFTMLYIGAIETRNVWMAPS